MSLLLHDGFVLFVTLFPGWGPVDTSNSNRKTPKWRKRYMFGIKYQVESWKHSLIHFTSNVLFKSIKWNSTCFFVLFLLFISPSKRSQHVVGFLGCYVLSDVDRAGSTRLGEHSSTKDRQITLRPDVHIWRCIVQMYLWLHRRLNIWFALSRKLAHIYIICSY